MLPKVFNLLLSLMVCSCSVSSAETDHGYPPLPLLFAEGTHYQVGQQIGQLTGDMIRSAMDNSTFFNKEALPHNQTAEGAQWYSNYLTAAQAAFPQYISELQGMADGAGLPFSKVFLWNLLTELELLMRGKGRADLPPPSCSDLYLDDREKVKLMGHNEDGSPVDINTSFMLHARITGDDPIYEKSSSTEDEFLAFCYAGMLCGKAFGVNFMRRTCTTVNALFPKNITTDGAVGRVFVNRATLSMDEEEIDHLLKTVSCASGFSLNVGTLEEGRITNYEVGPSGAVATAHITGYGYHFNMYLHSAVPQYDDPSSRHRLARVQYLPRPSNTTGILGILGDTGDKQYPIFRTATPPDDAATIATVLFDLSEAVMYVYRGNPAKEQPQLVVPLQRTAAGHTIQRYHQ